MNRWATTDRESALRPEPNDGLTSGACQGCCAIVTRRLARDLATGRLLPWPLPRPSTARSARTPGHLAFLAGETDRLLDGARAAARPDGTFAWLDDDVRPDPTRPRELWVATRMTHLFSVGHLLGRDGDAELADLGIMGLRNAFADSEIGGWFPALGDEGPTETQQTGLWARLRRAGDCLAHHRRPTRSGRPPR